MNKILCKFMVKKLLYAILKVGENVKKRKESIHMSTKFAKEETLPANKLRTLSQRDLMDLLSKHEKLGLIVKDELAIAMIKVETLEAMVERINSLEDLVEDLELSNLLKRRATVAGTEWEEKPQEETFLNWYFDRKNEQGPTTE
jgi:hypothetical protein